MSRPSRALITIPPVVRRGEVFSVSALVRHDMETGFRHTELGVRVPQDIVREFVCMLDGQLVFRADLHTGVAANPLLVFTCRANQSGTMEFRWSGDNGYLTVETRFLSLV